MILHYKKANFKNFKFIIDIDKSDFSFSSKLALEKTSAKIVGSINKKINISANFKKIYLKEILSIPGIAFLGEGAADLKISTIESDTLFKIKLSTRDSGLLGYDFGNLEGELNLFIGKSLLEIKNAKLEKGDSRSLINGEIDFNKKTYLNIKGEILSGEYSSVERNDCSHQ